MKKSFPFFLLISMLFLFKTASAQNQLSEDQKNETMERYKANMAALNLTEEQKPKVEVIERTFFDAVGSLRNSGSSKMQKYQTFKTISKNRDKQMKEVLTKDQYRIFKDNQEAAKRNLRQRRKG
jgi:hypothetical protein